MFPDELGLVLGLCCILGGGVGVSGRGANVSSTTASDGKDLIVERQYMGWGHARRGTPTLSG